MKRYCPKFIRITPYTETTGIDANAFLCPKCYRSSMYLQETTSSFYCCHCRYEEKDVINKGSDV